jgi:hypothetical protein
LNRRPGVAILLAFARNSGIDVSDTHLVEGPVSFPEAFEKLVYVPAANASRVWDKPFSRIM